MKNGISYEKNIPRYHPVVEFCGLKSRFRPISLASKDENLLFSAENSTEMLASQATSILPCVGALHIIYKHSMVTSGHYPHSRRFFHRCRHRMPSAGRTNFCRYVMPPPPPGGILLGILGWGVPPRSPNSWPNFRPKYSVFHTRFQTWPLKSIPVSDLCCTVITLRISNDELVKFSSNDIFWILLFLYFSFSVEKTNMFIRSRGSLENHIQFKTIMAKIYTRFQTKTAQKLYPLGRHITI